MAGAVVVVDGDMGTFLADAPGISARHSGCSVPRHADARQFRDIDLHDRTVMRLSMASNDWSGFGLGAAVEVVRHQDPRGWTLADIRPATSI